MSATRVFSHFAFKLTAEALSRLAMFWVILLMTRRLGTDAYGAWSSVYSFLSLFIVLTDLGLNLILVRDVSQNRSVFRMYARRILTAKAGLSLIFAAVTGLAALLPSWTPEEQSLLFLMLGFLVTGSWVEFVQHLLWSLDDQKAESIIKTLNRFLVAAGSIAGISAGSLELALAGSIAGNLISAGAGWFRIRQVKVRENLPSGSGFNWKQVFSQALPVSLTAFLVVIYLRVDVVMLKFFRGDLSEIGQYTAVMKIQDLVQTIPVLAIAAFFPVLNYFWAEERRNLPELTGKLLKFSLLFSVAVSAGGFFVARDLMVWLFSPEFLVAGELARILWWGLIPMGWNLIFLNLLMIAGKTRWNLILTSVSVGVNLILNWFFIPQFGAVGAAWATVAAETVLLAFLLVRIRKIKAFTFSAGINWRFFVPVLAMSGFLILSDNWPVTIRIIVAGGLYLSTVFSMNVAGKQDWVMMKNLLHEKKKGTGFPEAENF
ncbi:MAG: flippase [Bacteroidetes bacterium]|nr:flippase [Bacteroidota bacterium]